MQSYKKVLKITNYSKYDLRKMDVEISCLIIPNPVASDQFYLMESLQ